MKAVRDKLEGELHALERELTIDLPREIKVAVAMGDLRENAEYHAALDRQRYVRARIGQLRLRLSELGTMNMDRIPNDSVGLGSTVVIEVPSGRKRFEIVSLKTIHDKADQA